MKIGTVIESSSEEASSQESNSEAFFVDITKIAAGIHCLREYFCVGINLGRRRCYKEI